MEMSIKVLGAEHPHTLTSMSNLAFTWKGLGRDAAAVKLMERCTVTDADLGSRLSSYFVFFCNLREVGHVKCANYC